MHAVLYLDFYILGFIVIGVNYDATSQYYNESIIYARKMNRKKETNFMQVNLSDDDSSSSYGSSGKSYKHHCAIK